MYITFYSPSMASNWAEDVILIEIYLLLLYQLRDLEVWSNHSVTFEHKKSS